MKDKKLRYEDALNSVKSALEMGVVAGGGAAMMHMSCDAALKERILAACGDDDDERLGVEIMFRLVVMDMFVCFHSLCECAQFLKVWLPLMLFVCCLLVCLSLTLFLSQHLRLHLRPAQILACAHEADRQECRSRGGGGRKPVPRQGVRVRVQCRHEYL